MYYDGGVQAHEGSGGNWGKTRDWNLGMWPSTTKPEEPDMSKEEEAVLGGRESVGTAGATI